MLDPKTKARIAQEAKVARTKYVKEETDFGTRTSAVQYMGIGFKEGYIAGREAEAERAQPLIEAYRELHSISNDQLNEMEKLIKDYKPDREKVARAYELLKKIEALTNYNNPK